MSKRRKVICIVAAAVIVLAVTATWLLSAIFVVRNVVIDGSVSVGGEELIRAARLDMGGSIWKVEEADVREHLESAGRFALEGVTVQKPNTVILKVRERTRDAMVPIGGKVLVTDSEGYVIEICSDLPEDSGLYVRGLNCTYYETGKRLNAPEEQLEAMEAVLEAVRSQRAGDVLSELNVSDTLNLWMVTRTGIRVELGDAENMESKILWARSAVVDLESRGENRGTLDVSGGDRADFRPNG